MSSSLGKKYMMAITGQIFCAFLVLHLAGNLSLFLGKDIFNEYAAKLQAIPALVYAAEAALILFFLLHIGTALNLVLQNRGARPQRYAVDKSSGQKRWVSSSMAISGIIILVFVFFHIKQFKFGEGPTLYDSVDGVFSSLPWVVFYVVAMFCLSMHLLHGFQSAFQSLGLEHSRYTPIIKAVGYLYAFTMWAGYTTLPLWMHFK